MGRYHFPRYETMTEFIDVVKNRPYGGVDSVDGWTGTANYSDAIDLAVDGWEEMRPEVDSIRESIMGHMSEIMDFEFVPTLDVVGAAVDMGEFMTGVPECMVSFPMEERDTVSRVIRIVLDPGGNASVKSRELANRAAAVAALLESLQLSGRSLEIWVASPVKGNGFSSHSPVVCAHRAGTEVDINSMMFFCGHPSFLRRLIFSHRHMDGLTGMGSSHPISDDLASSVDADVVVQRAEHRGVGEPDAGNEPAEWVVWMCKQLGLIEN